MDSMAEPNWNKHSALSGWANVVVAAGGIGVVLWLGLRQPLEAAGTDPVGTPVMSWVPWAVASLYLAGVLVAGFLHWKAASLSSHTPQLPTDSPVGGVQKAC